MDHIQKWSAKQQKIVKILGQDPGNSDITNLRYYLKTYREKAGDLIDIQTLRTCLSREIFEHFDYREVPGICLDTVISNLLNVGLVVDSSAIYTIYQAIYNPDSRSEFCEYVLDKYVRTPIRNRDGVLLSRNGDNFEELLTHVEETFDPHYIVDGIPWENLLDSVDIYHLLTLIHNKSVLIQMFAHYRLLFSKYSTRTLHLWKLPNNNNH
jgi:hypothetical protein